MDLCIRVLFRLGRSAVYQTIAGDGDVNFRGGVCSATVSIPGGCCPYCPVVAFQCSFLGAGFLLLSWTLDAAVFVENSVDGHSAELLL